MEYRSEEPLYMAIAIAKAVTDPVMGLKTSPQNVVDVDVMCLMTWLLLDCLNLLPSINLFAFLGAL